MPLSMLRIAPSIGSRTLGLKQRRLILSSALSGMMLLSVPAWIDPTLRTAVSCGSRKCETIIWHCTTAIAAMITGSCAIEP